MATIEAEVARAGLSGACPRRDADAPSRGEASLLSRRPIRVLFIEDSEVDVELCVRALGQSGFDVSWERVEAEGQLERSLACRKPHAILSDFSMPRFDGMDALRVARRMAPGVPFIFLSGTIGEERAIEAISSGATGYVLKDNVRRLGPVVERALSELAERERSDRR